MTAHAEAAGKGARVPRELSLLRGAGVRMGGYLHGYTREEHRRLHAQARVFEPILHRDLQFDRGGKILEIGCGAGAQTAILLRRNPGVRVTAVDRSAAQLAAARGHFARRADRSRVTFVQGDASHLPFAAGTFDAAVSVWFLEHVPDPMPILREVRRVLRPGGVLHVREVFNHSVFVRPFAPAYEEYWRAFNTLQEDLGGHPHIGVTLPAMLRAAGFSGVDVRPENITCDATAPRLRRVWLAYWLELMLSGAGSLLAHRRVTPRLIAQMKSEYARLLRDPAAVFHFTPFFGQARR